MTAADDAATGAAGKPRRRRFLIAAGLAGVVAVIAVAVGSALWSAHGDPGATLSGSPLIGRPAPPLAGATVTGGHTSLASYRGRWVVVNFFASWCVPCQQETPELARFAAAHPGPGDPAVLGVVYQDDDGSVRDFTRHHRVTWPLLSYAGIDTANAYGVAGIPVTFLVAPDGRISAKILGGLRAGQLDTLVAQAERDSAGQTATTTRTTGS